MASRKDESFEFELHLQRGLTGELTGKKIRSIEEIEQKKIQKRQHERKRVENLKIAYDKLALKVPKIPSTRSGRSRIKTKTSRLNLLESTLRYLKALKRQKVALNNSAETSETNGFVPAIEMPVYSGTSDVSLQTQNYPPEQNSANHIPVPSPWLSTNSYIESENCVENVSILPPLMNGITEVCNGNNFIYCNCCEEHWQNGYYDYPNS